MMVQFSIQPDSEIPASTQLFNQVCFAIASRHFPPGYRLPSTRQLAMQTGLHRNTISKVYERLETAGFVEAQVGSGIYVRTLGQESRPMPEDQTATPVAELIEQSLDGFLQRGYTLKEVEDLFLTAITERLKASSRVIVTVPEHDEGAGKIMVQQLHQSLSIPIQLVFLEKLAAALKTRRAATVVTVRYFATQAEEVLATAQETLKDPKAFRIIPVNIYDYSEELELIKSLPEGSRLGLVSLSSGTLGVAEVMIYSLRGDSIYVMSAECQDHYKLNAVIRHAQTIISDQASYETLKAAVLAAETDLFRLPKIVCCRNYIDPQSIELLQRELGLSGSASAEDPALPVFPGD
ncbi:MAG: GntR family transcriptional regulator [Acaryochloridaceae cyanobacterium SU_2_1]|nr:GntR family transcriptional regulator [Acaryochloridaceae cyanobacterium SU_2_1]